MVNHEADARRIEERKKEALEKEIEQVKKEYEEKMERRREKELKGKEKEKDPDEKEKQRQSEQKEDKQQRDDKVRRIIHVPENYLCATKRNRSKTSKTRPNHRRPRKGTASREFLLYTGMCAFDSLFR